MHSCLFFKMKTSITLDWPSSFIASFKPLKSCLSLIPHTNVRKNLSINMLLVLILFLVGAFFLLSSEAWAQSPSERPDQPLNAAITPSTTSPPLKLLIPSATQGLPTTVFKVSQNSMVNLEVSTESAGELHIHAYRLSLSLKEGEKKTLSFLAKASGKFNIEWHPKVAQTSKDANSSVKPHHAHSSPLASLEVLPR